MHGGVRQQPDALNAQVRENLAAQADGSQNAPGARLRTFARAQFLVQNKPSGFRLRDAHGSAAAPPGSKALAAAGVWSISKPREVLCR